MQSGRKKLMIVEDEPRLREFLERACTSMDFEPVTVRAAERALRTIQEQQIDAAILDLTLPGMSGMELLDQMRQRNINIPVVILTGYGSLDAARTAIRLDVVDFLTKPCSLEDLDAALSRVRRRLMNEPVLTAEPPPLPEPMSSGGTATAVAPASIGTLEDLEREHIFAALRAQKGNRAATAGALGISERTLYYRLNRYQQQGVLPEDCRQR